MTTRLGELLRAHGLRVCPAVAEETPRWHRGDFCARCMAAPCRCPVCHGAGYYRTAGAEGKPADVHQCGCRSASIAQQKVDALAELSILPTLPEMTFGRFDRTVSGLEDAYDAASHYAEHGADGWLILHGAPGVGKTHLAAAIGHVLADQGAGVVMHVVPALLAEFRRCFAEKQTARYHRLFDGTLAAPVLILDDYGAERESDFAREQLYLMLDERYRNRAALVVTTNSLAALEPRVRDRLSDEGLSVVVPIRAASYRQRPVAYRRVAGAPA